MTGLAVTARRLIPADNRAPALKHGGALLGVMALTAIMTGAASGQTGPASAPGTPAVQSAPAPVVSGAASGQPAAAATTPTPSSPASAPTLPPQPPPPGLAAPPTEQRGILNGFSKWWDQSIADWKAKMQEQQTKLDAMNKQSADAAKNAATATQEALKNAADALRPSHVIEIQQTCPVAGNGAADCATAATDVCKAKGFSAGQPLDVRTAEKCADSLWVSGQPPTAADCPVETVLLRVACQ
ncbi:MAG TPA: hypothetical protein VL048_20740 [Xanthobacteraceae bacterium]|nr:hypothetical protein [Xanthobacteraceae bacterium]